MVEITLKNIITNKDMGYIVFKYPIEIVETMPPCYLKGFIDEYQKNPDTFNEKYKEWLTISLYPYFGTGRYKFYLPETGLTYDGSTLSVSGDVKPSTSAAKDLGSSTLRWNNIFTTDLQLSNMDKDTGNEVDGTKGDWTIQEGKDDLFLINRLNGKKYRFKLEEMKDE